MAPIPENAGQVTARIGRRLVEKGRISESDVQQIVVTQREKGLMFGEAAVGLGLLTNDDLQRALSEQYAYPYVEVSGSTLSPFLTSAHKPFSEQAEAVRLLRSQLLLRWFSESKRAIAVTSARSKDNASILAANLAICFAQLGEKTLLVDANFRSPSQHSIFGLSNRNGLSSILTGRSNFADAIFSVAPFETLSVVTTGPTPPNPLELLGRLAFSYMVETAPTSFDIIIIDAPPILEFSDAQVISSIATGCLLVTRRHSTTISDIMLSKAQIVPSGATLVGAVISG